MSRRRWFRHPIASYRGWRQFRRLSGLAADARAKPPLREFVYLDAVSLHSLLVSQNATIPSEVSQAISRADEAELSGSLAMKTGSELIGGSANVESSARYQTSNSNSMQSSRKAVVQTLFKELRELPLDFKLATPKETPARLKTTEALINSENRELVEHESAFSRGALIEVDVTLAVDPVFKLGAMMAEWSAMAEEFPAMFGSGGLLGFLRDSEPTMKVLDRFLAGLIPIKATATSYVVAEIGESEYVVHETAIDGLEITTRPLLITGVTEHISYWKDIRRVLFSGARFTILGRVARDGIHKSWTPVKLADLFSEVAPEFVDQINAIRSPSASDPLGGSQRVQQAAFSKALDLYRDAILPDGALWADSDDLAFSLIKGRYVAGSTNASVQRRAFDEVRAALSERYALRIAEPADDLLARQTARSIAGLELFPSFASDTQVSAKQESEQSRPDERIIDVEVIAIYW